jgi:hypothetical protein
MRRTADEILVCHSLFFKKQEQNDNARPVLSGGIANIAQYGTVFLCYPNWWGTLPMRVLPSLNLTIFRARPYIPSLLTEAAALDATLRT